MDKIKSFWQARALKQNPGSNDFMLKRLEINLLLKLISPQSKVLDIGCGNGETLYTICTSKQCKGVGIDYSENMIAAAKEYYSHNNIEYKCSALPNLITNNDFDYAITERCLLNLLKEQQYIAFVNIMSHLKPGGFYLMMESCIQGLEKINFWRTKVGLSIIRPPFHNTFLDENEVKKWENEECHLEKIINFTSTYYFGSRLVYAALRPKKLKYDSLINRISCALPSLGKYGPVRLFKWKKNMNQTPKN